MRRRGFMGFLGGGLVSAPSMAKAAVTQASVGLEAMVLPGVVPGAVGGEGMPASPSRTNRSGRGSSKSDYGTFLTDQIKELAGLSDDDAMDRLGAYFDRLDPDLAVNRSYSLSAKMRIMEKRTLESNRKVELRRMKRDLADWLKDQL